MCLTQAAKMSKKGINEHDKILWNPRNLLDMYNYRHNERGKPSILQGGGVENGSKRLESGTSWRLAWATKWNLISKENRMNPKWTRQQGWAAEDTASVHSHSCPLPPPGTRCSCRCLHQVIVTGFSFYPFRDMPANAFLHGLCIYKFMLLMKSVDRTRFPLKCLIHFHLHR